MAGVALMPLSLSALMAGDAFTAGTYSTALISFEAGIAGAVFVFLMLCEHELTTRKRGFFERNLFTRFSTDEDDPVIISILLVSNMVSLGLVFLFFVVGLIALFWLRCCSRDFFVCSECLHFIRW